MYIDNSVSALDYSSNIGVGFTFNPTLSISLSSSDLIIPNLAPGTTEESNSIDISVATNAAYGYTLSATTNSNNLIHNDNNIDNVFNSIATDANLESLTSDNTWGYSYKNNLASTPIWSGYSGLSTDNNKVLFNTDNNTSSSIDFKIAAKASSTQPSGIYTGAINFTAVTKPKPISLADAYASEGKELYHGYYKMQDMTSTICEEVEDIGAQLQVIDNRDNKIYWIAKLRDNHCWMTQNLDLDLITDPTADNYVALTSENTDLNDATSPAYQDGYAIDENGVITWIPKRDTIAYNNLNSTTWQNDNNHPYSYDYLDKNGNPVYPDSLVTKEIAGNHGLSGNYYNWSAAVASNDSNGLVSSTTNNVANNPKNSICPKWWRLPTISNANDNLQNSTNEFSRINLLYNNGSASSPLGLISSPLYFVRAGYIDGDGRFLAVNNIVYYQSSTLIDAFSIKAMLFGANYVRSSRDLGRGTGVVVRCVAK